MTKTATRRQILRGSLVLGAGALTACKDVTFPGLEGAYSAGDVSSANVSVAPPKPEPVLAEQALMHAAPFGGAFAYEVQRTKADWQSRLTPDQFNTLRNGRTEPKNSHPYVTETEPGTYHCAGCDLPVYGSEHKVILNVGWVFFEQGLDNSMMFGTDQGRIEAHCRRCGGHLGHVLVVPAAGRILHCVNGNGLSFSAAAA